MKRQKKIDVSEKDFTECIGLILKNDVCAEAMMRFFQSEGKKKCQSKK